MEGEIDGAVQCGVRRDTGKLRCIWRPKEGRTSRQQRRGQWRVGALKEARP